ncbi:MAG TPA: zinc ribbon domain-containing protein [Acidimicrobiales bacterium]|nr:zinc ribbon domain-containing protein [Acidimicrobiales bacterium]
MPAPTERRTVPTPDRDSAPYWQALADGRFVMQRCRACGRWTWPVRPLCSGCHGDDLELVEPSGYGEVYSWVVTHQAYGADLAQLVPYTVALVRVDEQDDILIPGRYLGTAEIHQGLRVRAAPERVTDEVGILHWTAAADAG